MNGLLLCLAGLVASYTAGRRSLGHGMLVVLLFGYFHGLFRARILDGFSHFIFDVAALGLYLGVISKRMTLEERIVSGPAIQWVYALIGWPFIMCLIPFNHFLIQLVGLRAAIIYIPFVMIGARAKPADLDLLARGLAILNVVAFAFCVYEYFMGIETLFPLNAVTENLYRSSDVFGEDGPGGQAFHRLPATFTSAHHYGGTMLFTVPFLLGYLQTVGISWKAKWLGIAGASAAALGVFLCGARTPVIQLLAIAASVVLAGRLNARSFLMLAGMACVVAYLVATDLRMQRFTTLSDTDFVVRRVHGSNNSGIFDLFMQYPFGMGLGSAFGTSIPYFLAHLAPKQIGLENQFGNLLMEQSLVGLLLWIGFVIWSLGRTPTPITPTWVLGARAMRIASITTWGTGLIGVGMLASIPSAPLMLFAMGMLAQRRDAADRRELQPSENKAATAA